MHRALLTSLVGFFLLAASAAQAITLNNLGAAHNSGANTVVFTVGGTTVGSNNLVIVGVYDDSSFTGTGAVTDSHSDTFTLGAHCNQGVAQIEIFYGVATAGLGTGATITYTANGSSTPFSVMNITYASGLTGVADGSACATAGSSAAPPASGSVTPSQTGDLFYGMSSTKTGTPSYVQATGFNTPPNSWGTYGTQIGGNLTEAGTTAHNYNPSGSATVSWTETALMAFKASGGAITQTGQLPLLGVGD